MLSRDELLNTLCDSRIRIRAFNRAILRCRRDLELREVKLPLATLGDCFCPWYYVDQGTPAEVDYGTAECSIAARAMRVNQSQLIDLNNARRRKIETYRQKLKARITPEKPILLAVDTRTKKCLILDGNKTSCAVYRDFLNDETKAGRDVPAVQFAGPYLENVVGDFCIINRD